MKTVAKSPSVQHVSRASPAIRTGILSLAIFLNLEICPRSFAAAQFTPEQLEKTLKRFPDADTDKDGKLSPEEARAYLRKTRGGKSTEPAADAKPVTPSPTETKPSAAPEAARRAKRGGGSEIKPDLADISYGPSPKNKIDLWLAKSDQPTPLVVFIHGGGFVGGDKSSISSQVIHQCLDAGVSIASINYRFRTEIPIQDVLRDSARAIQFLRSKARDYNIDKTLVATFGGSAGAGTSLWLAFHDDLADPQNADPVLRESTRLTAAASSAGQATYDILKWQAVLGSEEAMRFYPQSTWPAFYGLKTQEDLQTEKGKKIRADVDMLGLISNDDPPVWLGTGDTHDALANKGDTNHTPKHSEAVKKRCDEIGVKCVLKVGNSRKGDESDSQIGFLLKHLVAHAGGK